ncbi:MAG: hypothetical protein P4M12_04880 [Gammaproteobacteria bacterium]|nr:hypothetical protein [Gammaproteobacteria bacterium]
MPARFKQSTPQLLALTLFRLMTWVLLLQDNPEKNRHKIFVNTLVYLNIASMLISFFNILREHNVELQTQDGNTSVVKNKFITLYGVKEIEWKLGENQIYNKAKYLINQFDSNKLSIADFPDKPSAFNPYLDFMPYTDANFSMTTKARFMEYTGVPHYYVGRYLASTLSLTNAPAFIFISAYTLFGMAVTLTESAILNKQTLCLNLEGFTLFYKNWCSITPTCIGQQLSRTIRFSPKNRSLSYVMNYILEAETALVKAKENNEGLPNLIKDKIKNYTPMFFLPSKHVNQNEEVKESTYRI